MFQYRDRLRCRKLRSLPIGRWEEMGASASVKVNSCVLRTRRIEQAIDDLVEVDRGNNVRADARMQRSPGQLDLSFEDE